MVLFSCIYFFNDYLLVTTMAMCFYLQEWHGSFFFLIYMSLSLKKSVYLFFFFCFCFLPVLLRYGRHIALNKFKVYNIMI